jgi:hypothetical protein
LGGRPGKKKERKRRGRRNGMKNMGSRTRSNSLITINEKCKNQNEDLQLLNIKESQTVSQIALKIYMEGEKEKLTTKLSYNMLTQIFPIENNIIKLQINQHQLTHSIKLDEL